MAAEFLVPLTVFALVIGLAIWGGIALYRAAKARAERIRAAFVALAGAKGWTFLDEDRTDRPSRYLGFTPFGRGDDRRAKAVLSGEADGTRIDLFTYRYEVTSGSGKNRRTTVYHYKVAAVEMPISGPELTIGRESWGHKVFDALGGEDIDFESDEFSRRFWVKCAQRKFAYDVVTPAMMEWLLTQVQAGCDWQWRGKTLMVTSIGSLSPEGAVDHLEKALEFRRRLPRMLLAKGAVA